MKYVVIVLLLLIVGVGGFLLMNNKVNQEVLNETKSVQNGKVRYVAIGDSYTIGEGVSSNETYPAILTEHLRKEGVDITLVANPAVTGYTTQEAITYELPVLKSSNANFVTVLIGANDVGLRLDPQTFKKQFKDLLDGIQETLPKRDNIVILTIPDFSVTPYARTFGYTTDEIRGAITEFNDIIKDEAKARNLKTVDLYGLSGSLENDPAMLVADGLHPSGKQYALWERELFPVVQDILK